MTLADRAQGNDSKSEKTRMVMGALSEPREVFSVDNVEALIRARPGGRSRWFARDRR